jgi:hypothetical protein
MKCRFRGLLAVCRFSATVCSAALCAVFPASAAEPSAQTVGMLFNWYYTTSFGTGVYSVGDTTVTAVALPFYYTLREPTETDWGWRLTLPVTIAAGNFDLYDPDISQIGDIRLAALSALPGLEFIYPIRPHWRVNSFANVGRAWEFETKAGATVYQAGISTHYRMPAMKFPEVELGAKYIYAGFTSDSTDSTPVSLVALGLATTFPTTWTLENGRQATVGLYWIGTSYLTDIRFQLPEFGYTEIHSEQELGVTFGLRPAVKILGVKFDHVGLGYVVTNDSLRGIRLTTEFPF